jgi:hypothetical protein
MSSLFTTIRQRLQSVALTAGIASGQCKLGNMDLSGNKTWLADLASSGPWLFISSDYGDVNGYDMNGNFFVDGYLFFAAPQHQDYDFTDIADLRADLIVAWNTYSEFTKGGVLGPFRTKWGKPKPRTDLGPNVWCVEINFIFTCVADGVD